MSQLEYKLIRILIRDMLKFAKTIPDETVIKEDGRVAPKEAVPWFLDYYLRSKK